MITNMLQIDEASQRVLNFQLRVKNLSQIGYLTGEIQRMAASGEWRDYTTALGRSTWLESEFDYFLIASGVLFDDARQVIQWARAGAELARLMDPDADIRRRRPIEKAAESWHAPAPGMTFLDRARDLGWMSDDKVRVVVSRRALEEVKAGIPNEERARRSRAERLPAERRRELDTMTETLLVELSSADERRYVIDRVRASAHDERRPTEPRADAERLGWNVAALAKHWGVTRMTAHRWVTELRVGDQKGTDA